MPLTALRRSALIPDQPMSTISSTSWSSCLNQEGETSNRPALFISSLNDASYQWTPSMHSPGISPHSIQYSSWEINTEIASTPRQMLVTAQSDKLALPPAADDLLDTPNIDQWLFGGGLINNTPSPSHSLSMTDSIKSSRMLTSFTPSASINLTSALSPHFLLPKQTTYKVSREIVLRSLTGDASQDIYYPQSGILQALDDEGQAVLVTGGLMSFTSPPMDDFMPEKGDKIARGQPEKRRCNDDIYTPLWVRGDGTSREGWCSLCSPGRWLNLKTSQYLYHLQNTHGVIQTTGRFCPPPLQLRVHDDSAGTTEGWCGDCQQWIAICTIRKRRSFSAWFDHARKCRSSTRKRPLMEPYHRRALSSSPAMRLRAVKKDGHQRVSSMQESASFVVDFSESPSSSSSTHHHHECDFADSDSRR